MPTAKEDAQKLVDEFLPFALQMLNEDREFFPYGGHMKTDGVIVHEGATTGEERPRSQPLIDILRNAHRKRAADGLIRCACVVYDMLATPPNTIGKQDCIAFEIDHRDEYSAVVVFPYSFSPDGNVVTSPPFAKRGEGAIFAPD